jgi:PadR family transcriptional regulator PadR
MAAGAEIVQGTLDLLVLKAVSFTPQHGYAILDWLRRATDHQLQIEDAALYPALHRLEARRLIASEWGLSENNRRAKYYQLTTAGRRALRAERDTWERYVQLVAKVMSAPAPRTA